MSNHSQEDELVKILGLQRTLHGQLVPSTEDLLADWTETIQKLQAYLDKKMLEARISENAENLMLNFSTPYTGEWLRDYFSIRDKQLRRELRFKQSQEKA